MQSGTWQRNLRVLAAGQLVTISAMGIVIPLIPFILRDLGMTDRGTLERWSGLVFSGPFLAAALMSPVWGWVGDRYGHKKMVVRALVGLTLVNLLLVFVQSPGQFFAIRFTQGLVTGFVPAALAITSASTPRDELPGAMGRLAASASAGRLIGPAIGGLLAAMLSFRQLFLLVGVMIAAVTVATAISLEEPRRSRSSAAASFAAPMRLALAEPSLRLALPGLMAAMVGISMTMPIFPLYVEQLCSETTDPRAVTGVGFAVVAGFTMLGSAALGRVSDRLGLKTILVGSLLLAAAALVLHPHVTGIPSMLMLRALLGLAAAGIGPVLHAMISRTAPDGMRGGVTGLANSATILGFFVGPVAGGLLAGRFGVDGVFRIAALSSVICGVAAAIAARRVGRDREVVSVPGEVPR
ncbi:MAG: multidrug efflux MFS transporter [bacterium]|nr:multidrug efflux MFS transporter [bacterium]